MTVDEARKVLGEKYSKYTDEQIEAIIGTLTVLADIADPPTLCWPQLVLA